MSQFLAPLGHFQRFFVPLLIAWVMWAVWRTVVKRDLAVGLALYIGLVIVVDGFFNTGIYLPGLARGSIRYSELCAAFLIVSRPDAQPKQLLHRTMLSLIGLYFALLLLSVFRADSVMVATWDFRGTIAPQIIALMVAVRGLGAPEQYKRFFFHLAALVTLIAVFDVWDVFFDINILHSESLNTGKYFVTRGQGRFGSLFLNPNMLGAFVVLVFPGVFIWAMNERRPLRRLYGFAGMLGLVFCLVKTQSRGPLIAFAVGVLVLALGPCGGVGRSRRLAFLGAGVLLFMLFMPGFYRTAVGRFDDISQEMSEEGRTRQTTWAYTRRMIGDNPLLGIGFGEQQFLRVMDDEGFTAEFGQTSLDNPHNSYLQMTAYAGIPALFVFLLGNVILIGSGARRAWQHANPEAAPIAFGLAVGVTGFLTAAYPDMHLFTRDMAPVFWVFFGLLSAVAFQPQVAAATVPAATPQVEIAPATFAAAFRARRQLESENGRV